MTAAQDWRRRAACWGTDPALFDRPEGKVPDHVRERQEKAAKAICNRCPVRMECLDYALGAPGVPAHTPYGVYGGMTEEERAREKRNRSRRKDQAA
jgi:WhiB family transcriptional regulator, redox-sensing transcriptional regulator